MYVRMHNLGLTLQALELIEDSQMPFQAPQLP